MAPRALHGAPCRALCPGRSGRQAQVRLMPLSYNVTSVHINEHCTCSTAQVQGQVRKSGYMVHHIS